MWGASYNVAVNKRVLNSSYDYLGYSRQPLQYSSLSDYLNRIWNISAFAVISYSSDILLSNSAFMLVLPLYRVYKFILFISSLLLDKMHVTKIVLFAAVTKVTLYVWKTMFPGNTTSSHNNFVCSRGKKFNVYGGRRVPLRPTSDRKTRHCPQPSRSRSAADPRPTRDRPAAGPLLHPSDLLVGTDCNLAAT